MDIELNLLISHTFPSPHLPQVNDTCVNASCTQLYLVDFALSRNTIYRMECTADSLGVPQSVVAMGTSFYIECQSFFYNAPEKRGRSCASDQDCLIKCDNVTNQCQYSNTSCQTDHDCYVGKCDFFDGLCIADRKRWETLFMECFASSLSADVLNYISVRNHLNPNDVTSNFTSFVETLLEIYSNPDCVSTSGVGMDALEFRDHSVIQSVVYQGSNAMNCRCTDSIGVEKPCLDEFCEGERAWE